MKQGMFRHVGAIVAIGWLCSACGGDDDARSTPSKPDTNAFMTSYFKTFDQKVTDDILALYAPAVSAEISGIGKLEGRDAVRDSWLLPFTSAFPDYSHTVSTITVIDARATAEFVFKGTHQGPLLGFQPTGKELVLPILGTYDVDNEVVIWFKLEYDATKVLSTIKP